MLEETVVGLVRSIIVAFAAVAFGNLTSPVVRSPTVSGASRVVLLLLCTIPIFAPTLLTGYAYSRWSLPLIHHPWLKEIAYLVLLIFKVAPVGAVLFFLFPPAFGQTARHCLKMAKTSSGGVLPWRLRAFSLIQASGITFCAAMLLAFHEFEIASLTGVNAWTVRLFDAHAGGVPWGEAMSTAASPIAFQLLLVSALVWGLGHRKSLGGSFVDVSRTPRNRRVVAAWIIAGIAAGGVVFLPVIMIFKEAIAGLGQLVDSFALRKEITASALFGFSAGLLTLVVSNRLPLRFLGFVAIPGLCGPLIVGLGSVRIFQLESLSALYDSPIPLICVLVVLLLPLSFLIQMLRRTRQAGKSTHTAAMTGTWLPRWVMVGRGNFGVLLLLFLFAFSELVASAILAPPGMTTAPARLYNLMHYGHTTVLSAMVLVVFLFPLLAAGFAMGCVECVVRSRRARMGGR